MDSQTVARALSCSLGLKLLSLESSDATRSFQHLIVSGHGFLLPRSPSHLHLQGALLSFRCDVGLSHAI